MQSPANSILITSNYIKNVVVNIKSETTLQVGFFNTYNTSHYLHYIYM